MCGLAAVARDRSRLQIATCWSGIRDGSWWWWCARLSARSTTEGKLNLGLVAPGRQNLRRGGEWLSRRIGMHPSSTSSLDMALRDSPAAAAPSVLYLCHAHAASSISSHTSPRRRQDMSLLPARAAATNDDNAAATPSAPPPPPPPPFLQLQLRASRPSRRRAVRYQAGRSRPSW